MNKKHFSLFLLLALSTTIVPSYKLGYSPLQVACHEAAHAVATEFFYPNSVVTGSIEKTFNTGCSGKIIAITDRDMYTNEELRNNVIIYLAGPAQDMHEKYLFMHLSLKEKLKYISNQQPYRSDYYSCLKLLDEHAYPPLSTQEKEEYLIDCLKHAEFLINNKQQEIQKVANALEKEEILSGDQIRVIIKNAQSTNEPFQPTEIRPNSPLRNLLAKIMQNNK